MDEYEHNHEKRVDLDSELGISRRDLIRRGAVVGALVWVAPAISSITQPAFAASAPASRAYSTGVNDEVQYHVGGPPPTRYAKFDFGPGGGDFNYRDDNGTNYHVALTCAWFSGSGKAQAWGLIDSGNFGLGNGLLLTVTNSPQGLEGQYPLAACPTLPSGNTGSVAVIDAGGVVVTP